MIIDTHSHLNFKAYKEDLSEVIKRTLDSNIWMINVGTKYETSKEAVEIAEKYGEGVFAAIGMHPIHIKTDLLKLKMDEEEGAFAPLGEEFDKEKYLQLAKSKKVVAIGEIGLDYYYRPKTKTRLEQFKELQKKVFIEQLDLAEELNLPVIVHCRMAFGDLYEILSAQGRPASGGKKLQGVIHCFTGDLEQAKKFTELGFYLGINGIIDKLDLTEVIKNISLEKLLVETDCPYLTPKAEGDKRNEPIFVKHVVQKIADTKGISFDEVASVTTANARQLFNI